MDAGILFLHGTGSHALSKERRTSPSFNLSWTGQESAVPEEEQDSRLLCTPLYQHYHCSSRKVVARLKVAAGPS